MMMRLRQAMQGGSRLPTRALGLTSRSASTPRLLVQSGLRANLSRGVFRRPSGMTTSTRNYSTGSRRDEPPKFRWFVLIFVASTAAFAYSVRRLDKKLPQGITEEEYNETVRKNKMRYKQTAFSSKEASVVFVLGGPGAGKGTQCENLVKNYGFVHLSAGDLLRAEQNRPESRFGELIASYIKNGQIVPQEITVALLKQAMRQKIDEVADASEPRKFLIDGFPRKMDQAVTFEQDIAECKAVLFFDCPEAVMLKRLLKRGENSGRSDDNAESIKKRFQTFQGTSMPVVKYFDKVNKVITVSCEGSPSEVYDHVTSALTERGIIDQN